MNGYIIILMLRTELSWALYTAGSTGAHVGMPRWLRGLPLLRKCQNARCLGNCRNVAGENVARMWSRANARTWAYARVPVI